MTSLPWLDPDQLWFPPADQALKDPDGLLAVGGDLATERLKLAYRSGIFPWFTDEQPILWWSPDPRCVLFPDQVHVSRSLKRTLNSQPFEITMDRDFAGVMRHCAHTRSEGTWITTGMMAAYGKLHSQGVAHSVEAWNREGDLVGGLYGVALGRCFFGESMFSLATNASKVVMVYLARHLELWGYRVMDCQVESDHLLTMGACTIPRHEFLSILRSGVDTPAAPDAWRLQWRWPGTAPAPTDP